jgi:thiamine-phosphate pyrophosphorylase
VAGRLPLAPFLYPIIDVPRVPREAVGDAVAALARAGAALIQLRAKALPDGEFLCAAREATVAAHALGARLVVNDRADIARLAAADGVHLGQGDLLPEDARKVLPADALVGHSTHNMEQVLRALEQPIDYVAVGPVFRTGSKSDPDPVVGVSFVCDVRGRTRLPIVAVGGIVPGNAAEVVAAGADGIAVIGGLLVGGGDIEGAVRRYREVVRGLS